MGELMHTPGPWEWEDTMDGTPQYELIPQVIMGSNENVVFVSGPDAKLIAAAPELLAALIIAEKLCGSLTSDQCSDSIHIQIKDAIAKATNG